MTLNIFRRKIKGYPTERGPYTPPKPKAPLPGPWADHADGCRCLICK